MSSSRSAASIQLGPLVVGGLDESVQTRNLVLAVALVSVCLAEAFGPINPAGLVFPAVSPYRHLASRSQYVGGQVRVGA